jgi:hypothetical protein
MGSDLHGSTEAVVSSFQHRCLRKSACRK